ncbi:sodium/potassium-transporting ATPase subunit gamma isoform X1 [Pteropus medius]|uniref:sodium/potassium-transporting ATPase subunit gamma isoform X1 n=1 Tax=Pteropus vampyrus TaxID=132908 RepID=UPI00196B8F96|nr:sodium/potassium-transporting ATPase subunit gamma isoform X1 [Pteropus giganteus]
MFNAPTSSVATPRPGTLPEAEVAEEGSREEPGLLGTWQGRRRMTVAAPRRMWTHSPTAKDSAVGARRSIGKSVKMDCNDRVSCDHHCTGTG